MYTKVHDTEIPPALENLNIHEFLLIEHYHRSWLQNESRPAFSLSFPLLR